MTGDEIIGRVIITRVGEAYGIAPGNLLNRSMKDTRLRDARRVAMWIARHRLDMVFADVARALGCRSHKAVVEALNLFEDEISRDVALARRVQRLGDEVVWMLTIGAEDWLNGIERDTEAVATAVREAEAEKARVCDLRKAVERLLVARRRLAVDLHTRAERLSRENFATAIETLEAAFTVLNAAPKPKPLQQEHAHA